MEELSCRPEEAVIIGDDARSDVAGPLETGLQGILVRTGKYRVGVEAYAEPGGGRVAEDIAAAVSLILRETGGGPGRSGASRVK